MTSGRPTPSSNPLFLYAIVFSQFATPVMFAGVGVTLPQMGQDLHANAVSLGLIVTIYLGSSTAFLLPMGKLGDVTDKINLFKLGMGIFSISTFLIGFLHSIPWILAMRFIQGIASAMISATGMAIITEVVPPERRGRAFGLSIGAIYAGLALGPLIAGIITEQLDWHWVYWLFSLLLTFCFLTSLAMPKRRWQAPREPIHLRGSLLIIGVLMALIFGSALLNRSNWSYLLMALGVILLVLFVIAELKTPYPLLQIRSLLANHTLNQALSIQLLLYASAFGTTFLYSLYLQILRGYSPESAGQVLALGSVVMAILAPISGRLADRYSPRLLTAFGAMSVLLSVTLAIRIDTSTSLTYLITVLVLQGVGFALFSSPNMAIVMGSVPLNQTGIASALAAKMRSLGMLLSMLIVTLFLALIVGEGQLERHQQSYLSVMHLSFALFMICSAASLSLCGWAMRRKKLPPRAK